VRLGNSLATSTFSIVGLLGDGAVESHVDYLGAGQAEAFRTQAGGSGVTGIAHVYIDSHNAATTLIVGLYSNASGHPGTLLSTGSVSSVQAGAWNAVSLTPSTVVAGATYWLAVLGEHGTLRYRDRRNGPCPSETSATGLGSLPVSWRTGKAYADCPISAYITAAESLLSAPAPVEPAPAPAPPPPAAPTASFTYSPASPIAGETVTFDGSGSTCPNAPCTYAWSDDGSATQPATPLWPLGSGQVASYVFTEAGTVYLRLVVTDAFGQSATVEHNVTIAAASTPPPPPPPPPPPAAPANTALPTIAGTAVEGNTLTAGTGSWSGSPTGYAYQWQDCDSSGASCVNVAGASASSYRLLSGDVGHTVRVVVTAANEGGSASAGSSPSAIVQAAPTSPGGLFISPTGSDANACTQAQPCLTMNHAYAKAVAGQTVQMLAGSYPAQAINSDSSKTSSADVVFEPAEGAAVRVTGTIHVFASHLTIENMTVQDVVTGNYDQTAGRPDPTDITLLGLTGRNFEIDSTTNVTVEGGSWGPASACGGPYGGNNNSIRQPTSTAPANILIDKTVIHDVQSYNLVECHIEGLAIFAGTKVTVSNTKFYGNSVYDIFMQANSGGHPNEITLANNWLATAVDNSGANGHPAGYDNGIALGNELAANVTVEDNHFNDVLNMNDAGDISKFTNVHVRGNVGMQAYNNYPCGSLSGIEWAQNIWQNDKCVSSDVDLNGAAMPYQTASNDSTMNYTLTGTYAGWPGSVKEEAPAKEEPPVKEPSVEGASVFVSPSGSDSGSCTASAPCKTLARAYSVAASGATVQVAAGTYADTSLPLDSTKGTSNVVFVAAPGTTPAFSNTLHLQAHHVEMSGLKFATLWVDATAQNDILRNDTYKNFEVISSGTQAPSNISFVGGSAGPAEDENNIIGSNGTSTTASPTNISIKGMHIHDYKLTPGTGAHVDCLQVWAANGLTVEGSTFNDCEVFDIFVQFLPGGSAGTPTNVTIQNNFLDCCRTGYYSIMLPYHTGSTGGSHFTNVTIRNNSTNKAITADPDATYTNVKIDGNIGPSLVFYSNAKGTLQAKPEGISADYNVWYEGNKVGSHDQEAPSGFLEPANLNFNLLEGAAAINHGDPEDYPPTDIYGKARPNPPDAGATQH
jgi:hypothetical protein